MKRMAWGSALVLLLTPGLAYGYTAVHIQSAGWWDTLVGDAVDQAAMWIGDMGALPLVIIGVGLFLIVLSGIVALVHRT